MATGFLQICKFLDEYKTTLAGKLIVFVTEKLLNDFIPYWGLPVSIVYDRETHAIAFAIQKKSVKSWAHNSGLTLVTPQSVGASER